MNASDEYSGSYRATRRTPTSCPVIKEARSVAESAQELASRARKLRRSLSLCKRCSQAESCALIAELNWQIQVAIREVASELGLS